MYMENDTVNNETIQFIKDVETLRRKGLFKRDAELVTILEWDKSNMSLVLNKRRNVPKEKLKKFALKFAHELKDTIRIDELATKTPTIEELIESKNYVIRLLNEKSDLSSRIYD